MSNRATEIEFNVVKTKSEKIIICEKRSRNRIVFRVSTREIILISNYRFINNKMKV